MEVEPRVLKALKGRRAHEEVFDLVTVGHINFTVKRSRFLDPLVRMEF